jgi:putative toxin-antitoxin system antitoxin component (TIGR02293 family)
MSNDKPMAKRKTTLKQVGGSKGIVQTGWKEVKVKPSKSEEEKGSYRSFRVTRGGKQKSYPVQTGFGYFIPSLKKAENLGQVNELVEAGLPSREIQAIIEYLDLNIPEIARAAAVSPSTVSRWKRESSIGVPGSNQFFRIDEVIRKGVELFGGLEEFKYWMHKPNMALGNAVPAKLITSLIGVEMVDEALDALHYGNVM